MLGRAFAGQRPCRLAEIDDRYHVFRQGTRVIDLGCAPGGWLQIALERGAASVAGIDLLPVEPLVGANIIEADFTADDSGARLMEMLGGQPDVILSDMAPNTTGHRQTDHLRIVGLIEAAAEFATTVLKPGGVFISKAFQGGETGVLLADLKRHFAEVRHVKPKASRLQSSELYLLARGFKGR